MGGGEINVGGNFSSKILILFTLFFQFLTQHLQIFAIFSPKNANFDNFFQKRAISTSESEKYEESFSQFFGRLGKKSIFLTEYSPMSRHKLLTHTPKKSSRPLLPHHEGFEQDHTISYTPCQPHTSCLYPDGQR